LVRISSEALNICTEYIFVSPAEHPFSALLDLPRSDVSAEITETGVVLTNHSACVALYCDLTIKDANGETLTAENGNLCLLPGESRTVYASGVAECNALPLN
jgi:hypothetical protein